MLHNLAISGYRSLKEIVLPLGQLNLITGPNGSGKSNVYRALHPLADTADGRLIRSLAREGGLSSTLWAGPESFSRDVLDGKHPVQGTLRKKPISLRLGFTGDDYSYSVELGLPKPSDSMFSRDPVIKRECLWRGPARTARDLLCDRRGQHMRCRPGNSRKWEDVPIPLTSYASMLTEFADPQSAPEVILLRDSIRSWRFYDHFRTDADSPARRAEVGTFTPVLSGDGSDLAAALQTIQETGDSRGLVEAIDDAFPGSEMQINQIGDFRMQISLKQLGMLRPLNAAELSDGTLRYLLLVACLLTSRPPDLMVLNEPETSLHPDLLPALGRMICRYSQENQIVVVTHAKALVETLSEESACTRFELEKSFGATELLGVNPFDTPLFKWPSR